MERNRWANNRAWAVVTIGVCAWFLSYTVASHASAQHGVPDTTSPAILGKNDLIRILDCATRSDQPLAVRPEFYSGESFTLRYLYPVLPGREANVLNLLRPAHWVSIILYHRDGHSAALFEVGFDGPEANRNITLLDAANLEKQSGRWEVRSILNGGASTWPEIAQHVRRLSALQAMNVARNDVSRSTAACEFPPRGLEFEAVSPISDHSSWNFKDGMSDGIRFKEQFGPFKNTDLKRTPFDTVFMIGYGPS